MDTNKIKNMILSAGLIAIASLAFSTPSRAQSPSPSPSPGASDSRYNFISSVELGVRGLDVNGDHEKYRSDLNYQPGFRIFDSSFLMEDKGSGPKPFDSLFMSATGWGADPYDSFRLNMSRTGIYKFESNVRRVRYYNNLKNFATLWTAPVSTQSQHQANTQHHFGDFDLTIFPERAFRIKLGYSFNNTDGPGFYTIRFPGFEASTVPGTSGTRGDEYQVNSTFRSKSQDLRAGVEGELLGFNVGLTYGHRAFRDKSRYSIDAFNLGNDPSVPTTIGPTTSVSGTSNLFTRIFPTKGTTDWVNFYVQRTFARKLDFTGRFVYAESRSDVDQQDTGSGTSTGSSLSNRTGVTCSVSNPQNCVVSSTARVLFDLDNIFVTGKVKRPQSRGDLGLTYRVTDDFRISNTFTFDQYSIGGGNEFLENMQGSSFATTVPGFGAVPFNSLFDAFNTRGTSYRRFGNTIEADYQINHRIGFYAGYRFGHRKVAISAFEFIRTAPASSTNPDSEFEEFTNTTHAGIGGLRYKPMKDWAMYVDVEGGQTDNPFTRLSNNKYFNFRFRSITHMKQFTLNLSAATRDNKNPGVSEPITSTNATTGVVSILFPETEADARFKTRYYSGTIDWTPHTDYSVSAGYTYNHQTSDVDIIVPVGAPAPGISSTTWFLGTSQYFVRDNFFHFDVYAHPIKWVSAYVSYRIDKDNGQGDRQITRPQDMITSYPFRFQAPEVRLAFRITKNIDWNVGYQYYDYRENNILIPFMSTVTNRLVPQIQPDQNYTAHMPYTSLRIHWGGREETR